MNRYSLDRKLEAAAIALAIFGGRKLSHAGARYIHAAQVYYGVDVIESALDGRDLFEPETANSLDDFRITTWERL